MNTVYDATYDQTEAHEKAGLRDPDSDFVVHIETWEKMCDFSSNTETQVDKEEKPPASSLSGFYPKYLYSTCTIFTYQSLQMKPGASKE